MLDKEATAPEAISDGREGNKKQTNTSQTTRQPQLAKELRTCTQTATEAKVRQAPYGQKNYPGHGKQSIWRKPCGRRKAHGVGCDPRCKSSKNLLNNVRALPKVGSDELTDKFEKDSDIRSAQRRTNQQKEALPRSTRAKVVEAYDLGKSEVRAILGFK